MAYRGKFDARYRNKGKNAPIVRTSRPQEEPTPMPQKRRGPTTGTVIFWTLYCLLIIAFFGAMFFVDRWLEDYLVEFQASEPSVKCEELFQEFFADPDWGRLYDMAGIPSTRYEGKESFVNYMEEKVGDAQLTYQQTSGGLAGKKYFVKLGEENLGYFTLVDARKLPTDMRDWQLGEVRLNYSYDLSILVQKTHGITIYVNGVALEDADTIQVGTTLSEKYIPRGLHGPRIYTQAVSGLMCPPEVTATDEAGNPVEVSQNPETGVYIAQTSANTASQAEIELAVNTAKAYSLRMISQNHKMATYFDTTSDSYKAITSTATFMQKNFYRSHTFDDHTVTGYYRYSDSLFSIHVKMPMLVTRTDGTVKDYVVDHTFFFEKQGANWKCIIMTNVDVMEQEASVRLTFALDDGTVLASEFFDSDAKSITAPVVTAPEGKEFLGWFVERVDENGKKTLNLMFSPSDSDKIPVPEGYTLEPMTLVALFGTPKESAGA